MPHVDILHNRLQSQNINSITVKESYFINEIKKMREYVNFIVVTDAECCQQLFLHFMTHPVCNSE